MKVSLDTIKRYTNFDLPVDELVAKINSQLGAVEEVIELGTKYSGAVIVRVVSCEDHPNADRLHVCMVDDGGVVEDVERDHNGHVQVVCGAPNVRSGMFAVWLPPKSTVPSSWDDKEPFVLDARELRGVVSNGMLASPKELALGDDHDGILEIKATDLPASLADNDLKPGQKFGELFGLNDAIIDIENKMFTHRPDLFGQIGVAREIAGIQHKKFLSPDWYWKIPHFESAGGLKLEVFNDAPDKSTRFMAVAMKGVTIAPSPAWLKAELVRLGGKPINNIVDITNYVMLLTSQPVHAYDYSKLRGHKLGVRMASEGESVKLLNDKTYKLDAEDIVIADGEGVVGLAGVMGGGESEVDENTKDIVLEVATFDMYAVRKSAMRHGVFTDALTRFNKGQSPLQNDRVLSLLVGMIQDVVGGQQASEVVDKRSMSENAYENQSLHGTIQVSAEFINQRLGLDLDNNAIAGFLRNVEFAVVDNEDGAMDITAPFWRTDIELPEDIVEEVGRLYGFDKLPRELPKRTSRPVALSPKRRAKDRIRQVMKRAGANEVLTYSFVHENLLSRSGQDKSEAFQLSNALSPDLQYYRLSVLPSLLDKVNANIRAGHDEFVLYEIGKGHNKKYHADDDDGLPSELEFVDMVYASKKQQPGAAFYYMRTYVEAIAKEFGREVVSKPITENVEFAVTAPFELSRSAFVHDAVTDEFVGMIGELKSSVVEKFKLPEYSAAATLDMAAFEKFESEASVSYKSLSRYPGTTQDLTLKSATSVKYEEILSEILRVLDESYDESWSIAVEPLSVYRQDDAEKATTFRFTIVNYDKTLREDDASGVIEKVSSSLASSLNTTVA